MRELATLVSVLVHLAIQAQPPTVATLLSLADCLDTACVSERLRPLNYCLKGGREKDGWMWGTCGPYDQLADHDRMLSLGFFGYAKSNYRDYILGTGDTTIADMLTQELLRLGFTAENQSPEGYTYRNNAYPTLEIRRFEKRHISVEFKRKEDPINPRAEPTDPFECEDTETLKEAKKRGFDRIERIPKVYWVFKAHVPTPHLGIHPSDKDGAVYLYYPVIDAASEFFIRDLWGKEVFRSTTQGQRTEVDVAGLSNGVYYLTVFSKWGMISKPFMKN